MTTDTSDKKNHPSRQRPWQGFQFINQLDSSLKVVAGLHAEQQNSATIQLRLSVYYQNDFVGRLQFLLHQYQDDEAMALAQNIKSNDFIVDAIEQHLAGDVVE